MMTPQEVERMLRQTLSDARLSGGERRALGEVFAEAKPDGQQTAAFRSQAFRLAREAITDPQSHQILDWLEDVVKVLHPVRPAATSHTADFNDALFSPGDDLCSRVCRLFDAVKSSVD